MIRKRMFMTFLKFMKKLNNNPREFAEHYDVINYGIKFVLKSSKKLHFEVSNSINNYLTNW